MKKIILFYLALTCALNIYSIPTTILDKKLHSTILNKSLHRAIRHLDITKIEKALKEGANPHAQNIYSESPLRVIIRMVGALSIDYNHEPIYSINRYPGAKIASCYKIFKLLIAHGANTKEKDLEQNTLLHYAAKAGWVKGVLELLEHGVDKNATNKLLETPLHLAIKYNHVAASKILISAGADLHKKTYIEQETPLHIACDKNLQEIVADIIRHRVSINAQNIRKETPFHIATRTNSLEIVRLLLFAGAAAYIENSYGENPLHIACSRGNTKIAQALVNWGAPLNSQNYKNQSPLHLATDNNWPQITKFLISRGANINIQDQNGNTPLHTACLRSNLPIVSQLIIRGANVNAQNKLNATPLHVATWEGVSEIMQLLIGHGADATTKTSTGANCLHVLASANPKFKKSSHRLERLLIKKITNLNEQDNNGNTPLHIAIFAQNNQLAARLVAHKADLNIQNRSGETALHEAAHSGNVAGIKLLLKHGANRTIQNSAGKTAINIVQEQPESKINPKTREQIKKLLL